MRVEMGTQTQGFNSEREVLEAGWGQGWRSWGLVPRAPEGQQAGRARARMCAGVHWQAALSRARLCDPLDCSRQVPLSTGVSRQEYYWSG